MKHKASVWLLLLPVALAGSASNILADQNFDQEGQAYHSCLRELAELREDPQIVGSCKYYPAHYWSYSSESYAGLYRLSSNRTDPKYFLIARSDEGYTVSSSETSPSPNCEGNPCDPLSGAKREYVEDLKGSNLAFGRYYLSQRVDAGSRLGGLWKHSFEYRLNRYSKSLTTGAPTTYPATKQSDRNEPLIYSTKEAACLNNWDRIKSTYRRGTLAHLSVVFENDQCLIKDSLGTTLAKLPIISGTSGIAASNVISYQEIQISTPSGVAHRFSKGADGSYINIDSGTGSLKELGVDIYELTLSDLTMLRFQAGLLVQVTNPNGVVNQVIRDDKGRISRVENSLGDYLDFGYDASHRLETIDSNLGSLSFGFDGYENLSKVTYADDKFVSYHYADTSYPNHLTGYTDENGVRFATWSYDDQGRAISSEHAGGVERVTLDYQADRTIVTDALGAQRTYHLGSQGGRWVVTSIDGDRCRDCNLNDGKVRDYDNQGRLTSKTDWEGNVTTYMYNNRGLETSRTDASGTPLARTITTTWDAVLPLPLTVTEPTRIVRYTYDAAGRLLTRSIEDPVDSSTPKQEWAYSYTAAGLLETINGPRTDVNDLTIYSYDAQGNLSAITNALGHVVTYSDYSAQGLPGQTVDANGVVTELGYTARGWLNTITRKAPLNSGISDAVTTLDYDGVGQVTKVTYPEGHYLNYEYDDARRLTAIENAKSERMEYGLDLMGNIESTVIKNAQNQSVFSQTRVYDQLSQLLRVVSPLGQITHFEYDGNGLQTKLTNALNQSWVSSHDALRRLVSTVDPNNETVGYNYDDGDRIAKVTDQRGLETSYAYDPYGNLSSLISPDTGTTTYQYDQAGNRIYRQDARGVVTAYTYDALNRLTGVNYPANNAENVSYVYDDTQACPNGKGKLTAIVGPHGQINYCYNVDGYVSQVAYGVENISYSQHYDFSPSGLLKSMTYPGGRGVSFAYDNQSQVSRITATSEGLTKTLISSVSYLPFGGMSTYTYGNGVTRTLGFDQSYRLTQNQTIGQSSLLDLAYGYDAIDNIVQISDAQSPAQTQDFTYDPLSRLETAAGSYGAYAYSYDSVGNRTGLTHTLLSDSTNETYTYDVFSNRLTQVETVRNGAANQTRNLGYSPVGNLVQDSETNQARNLQYNQANRLEAVDDNGVPNATYLYNPLGQRIAKVTLNPVADKHYHYDLDGNLIAVTQASTGVIETEYVYLNGERIALLSTKPDTDADGYSDPVDAFPSDPSEWLDTDGDGIGNNSDPDVDGDGVTNAVDTDDDGDGVADAQDAFPLDPNEWSDLDGDGVGDNRDLDDDGDGVADTVDVFPSEPSEWLDTDGDGIGDNADLDRDGDQMEDVWELNYFGGLQEVGNEDYDSDGVSNLEEFVAGTDPTVNASMLNWLMPLIAIH